MDLTLSKCYLFRKCETVLAKKLYLVLIFQNSGRVYLARTVYIVPANTSVLTSVPAAYLLSWKYRTRIFSSELCLPPGFWYNPQVSDSLKLPFSSAALVKLNVKYCNWVPPICFWLLLYPDPNCNGLNRVAHIETSYFELKIAILVRDLEQLLVFCYPMFRLFPYPTGFM